MIWPKLIKKYAGAVLVKTKFTVDVFVTEYFYNKTNKRTDLKGPLKL